MPASSSSSSAVYVPAPSGLVDVSFLRANYSTTTTLDRATALKTQVAVSALNDTLSAKIASIAQQDTLFAQQISSLQASDALQSAGILSNANSLVSQASRLYVECNRASTQASGEQLRALQAETLLSTRISDSKVVNDTQFTAIANAMTSSHQSISDSFSTLATSIIDCQQSISGVESLANTEALTRSSADVALQAGIEANKTAIALEATRAGLSE